MEKPEPPEERPNRRTGAPFTIEEKERIFARQQKALALRSQGYTYPEIAERNDCHALTARADIRRALKMAAKNFSALETREELAELYRADLARCEEVLRALWETDDTGRRVPPKDPGQAMFFQDIMRQRRSTVDSMARLYGYSNGNAFILPGFPMSPTNAIATGATDWAEGLDPVRVRELRGKFLEFVEAAREPVAAEFTIEEPGDESHNGHSGPTETEPPPDLSRPPGAEEQSGPATDNGSEST